MWVAVVLEVMAREAAVTGAAVALEVLAEEAEEVQEVVEVALAVQVVVPVVALGVGQVE